MDGLTLAAPLPGKRPASAMPAAPRAPGGRKEVAIISLERQIEVLRARDATGPDVIVQAASNLAFAQPAVEAERWPAKPVIAAHAAISGHALRSPGLADVPPAARRLGMVG